MLTVCLSILLSSCQMITNNYHVQNVGLLLDGSVESNAWNKLGYNGLMSINQQYDVNVMYETHIQSEEDIINTVNEFIDDGVNLIFGHSNIYGKYFTDLADQYPDVHFVYFNGSYTQDNLTSFTFSSHAMGFFSGIIASEMTETNEVGVIAAYEWQPEVEGFYEGAKYHRDDISVRIKFINNWDDDERVDEIYNTMRENAVDVLYPTGDYYSEMIIHQAEQDGLYTIGYVEDQFDISPETVLTSTIQHVDQLYPFAVERLNKGSLTGDMYTFDFQDDFISLGTFNEDVPESFQQYINSLIEDYKATNLLPNEVN